MTIRIIMMILARYEQHACVHAKFTSVVSDSL